MSTTKKGGAAKLGSFSTFDDATPPVSPAAAPESPNGTNPPAAPETPAEPPAPPAEALRPAKPARVRTVAQKPAELSKAQRALWRTALQNAARKLARDREQLDESEQAWADTVAEARALGVPGNVILAAAADADVELPE